MICPYGKLFIPKGSAFDQNAGLKISIQDNTNTYIADFIHSQDVFLESGEIFTTVTKIINENIYPKKLILYSNSSIVIDNMIEIVIKNKNTKKIISSKYIGQLNEQTVLQFIEFSSPLIKNLNNDAIILEIKSINLQDTEPCCDKLPSQIIISDVTREVGGPRFLCIPLEQYYNLPTTTTTTTQEPFLIDFLTDLSGQTTNLNSYATFSFSAISINDIDFSYWFEVSKDNGYSWSKASKLSVGKSRQNHTLLIQATAEKNNYKYRVCIVNPKILKSNTANLNIIFPTTTTTTVPPCIAVPTTTTLAPPPLNGYLVSGASQPSTYNGMYCFYGYNYPINDDPYAAYPIYEHVSGNRYLYLSSALGTKWFLSDSLEPGAYTSGEYYTPPTTTNFLPSTVIPSGEWYSRPVPSGYLVSGAFPTFFNGMYYISGYSIFPPYAPNYRHESEDAYMYLGGGGGNGLWYITNSLYSAEDDSYGFYHEPIDDINHVPFSGWGAHTPNESPLETTSGTVVVYPDPNISRPTVFPSSCPIYSENIKYFFTPNLELNEDIEI